MAASVVGMAGRFPGAADLAEYWRVIAEGRETITFFAEDDVAPTVAARAGPSTDYVAARGVLADIDRFDAAFFGISPREAEVIDPQHRVLIETAWHALEDAGLTGPDPVLAADRVGVFAGVGHNDYYYRNVLASDAVEQHGEFRLKVANEKDYLATRIADLLGLRGPAVSVQSACSTTLVAIAMGLKAIRAGDCDAALCGGASIPVPQETGHVYNEGSVYSRDGHVRPYDASATGTVFCSGAGMVVLMREDLARSRRLRAYALLLGAAFNNDGGGKASFMAPSARGQAEVYALALRDAAMSPAEVTYIEGHGTGTPLGDPIEVEALSKVYGNPRRPTWLGTVKGNIGHTDAAAGVAGFIKAALSLFHGKLAPSINFDAPNPRIPFDAFGVQVNTTLRDWPVDRSRVAAVTALGVGGTNAHAILEAADPQDRSVEHGDSPCLLLFSGKSPDAAKAIEELVSSRVGQIGATDAASTLAYHRRPFRHRRFKVVSSRGESLGAGLAADVRDEPRPVAFLFPGQGAQYAGMGHGLYARFHAFRDVVDHCAEVLRPEIGLDVRDVLGYRGDSETRLGRDDLLHETRYTQPALFTVGVALAALWKRLGVPPSALVGHSIGEYAAACVAGVMSMDDAARLVALRGRLMGALPRGGMLAVGVDQASAVSIAGDALDVAAINGSRQTVLSGEHRAVEAAAAEFARRDIRCTVLKTSHAFHSRMMDAIVPEFEREVARVALRGPEVPVVSTATGAWLSAAQATDPRYWATQLRQPVRFLDALATLWRAPDFAALELGPRATATALARGLASGESRLVVPSMADSAATEVASLLAAVGELWCAGQPVDLAPCISSTPPVWLPGYAFARDRHWIEPSERRATPSGDPSVSLTALLRAQTELLLRQVDVLLDGGHRGSRERGDR